MRLPRRVHSVSLRFKILLPVTTILAAAFLFIYLATSRILDDQRQAYANREGLRNASQIEGSISNALASGGMDEVARIVETIHSTGELPPARIAIHDTKGNAVIDTSPGNAVPRLTHRQPPTGKTLTQEDVTPTERYIHISTSLGNTPRCYRCHGKGNQTLGYLEVDIPVTWQKHRNDRSLALIALCAGATLALVCGAVVASVNAAVVNPLRRLSDAMVVVKTGQRHVRLDHHGEDEIGELNTSFKEMLQEIASAERQLVETGQRLAKAEKLAGIGLMTAGVAHEINNPLAAVAIAAESLDLPGIKPEHRHRLATSIMEGTKRIQSIVTELLTLDPTRTIDRKSTAVRDVIDDVLSKLEIPSTISIDYRLEENLPSIRADRDSLSRALGNIFKNAIQAMNKGGILTISAEPIGSGMIITIEDTGYGMDIEQVERIFDPFYTTREVGFGFGLGLSFAHAVVKQHGGDILVRSEPGQGTVFMVALPLDEKDAVKQSDWLSRVPSLERESKDA